MPRRLQGVLPIVHTPFADDDAIDEAALAREVDFIFAVGADGLGTGMVSELLRLTTDERRRLTELLVGFAADRGPVFAAVTSESTRQAVELARHAQQAGCAAIMAAPPLSTRLGDDALYEHFQAVAEAVEIPLIVQDASGYVGQAISLSVYQRLLQRYGDRRILFKPEASPVGPNLSLLRDATDGAACIFEGSGGIHLVDSFRRGIAGTMPGVDLLDGVVRLWQALRDDEQDEIYRLSFPIGALVSIQLQAGLDGFLAVEKHLLHKRGLFPNVRRRKPYGWELDRETIAEVDRLFAILQSVLKPEATAVRL